MAAGIDVLRAQVQMQPQQQRMLAAQNQYEQQKMSLARTIGMPVSQQFQLADTVPYASFPAIDLPEALARAYERRPEYLAAQSRTRAAEFAVKAAKGEAVADRGSEWPDGHARAHAGQRRSEPMCLSAGMRIPIFQGGKVKADVALAETLLRQNKLQLENLRSRIEYEIRSALHGREDL